MCKIRRSRRLSLQSLDPSALATYCTTEWPTGKCLIFVLMHLYGLYMYISFFWYMYICTSWEHMMSSIVFCNDISVCFLLVCILFLGHVALWHIIWDIILLFIDVTEVKGSSLELLISTAHVDCWYHRTVRCLSWSWKYIEDLLILDCGYKPVSLFDDVTVFLWWMVWVSFLVDLDSTFSL